MSLAKLPLLLSGLITTYIIQTPPQARVPATERAKGVGLYERYLSTSARMNVEIIKVCTSLPLLVEAAVILGNRFPSHTVSRWILRVLVHNNPGLVQRLVLSPTFLAACAIGVAGGALRYQCYRTLGRFFTLELAVHGGHKLVTEGPYRYVRHPSYTAWSFGSVGVCLMSATRGSWFRESGLLETQWGQMVFAFCALYIVYGTVGLTLRVPTEDEMLRREFGEEWEAYARRVPYRLVPYAF